MTFMRVVFEKCNPAVLNTLPAHTHLLVTTGVVSTSHLITFSRYQRYHLKGGRANG